MRALPRRKGQLDLWAKQAKGTDGLHQVAFAKGRQAMALRTLMRTQARKRNTCAHLPVGCFEIAEVKPHEPRLSPPVRQPVESPDADLLDARLPQAIGRLQSVHHVDLGTVQVMVRVHLLIVSLLVDHHRVHAFGRETHIGVYVKRLHLERQAGKVRAQQSQRMREIVWPHTRAFARQ